MKQIKARIDELDKFYEDNFNDYRIAFFEKQKLKLRRLVNAYRELFAQDTSEPDPASFTTLKASEILTRDPARAVVFFIDTIHLIVSATWKGDGSVF